MDVNLPDGTLIKDVPDNFTKAQLVEKLQTNGMNVPKEWMAPAQPESYKPSMSEVAVNAAGKVLPGLADSVLNTPNRLLNLAKAGVGTAMTAAGSPPEEGGPLSIQPDPNYAMRGAEAIGLVRPGIVPEGGLQRGVDLLTQGAVGGALTGGTNIPAMATGAALGTLSAGASGATAAMGGGPGLQAMAGVLAPAVASRVPQLVASTAPRLMQSALKPTLKNQENGNAGRAIQTMLDEGINVSQGGAQKIRDKIGTLNDQISQEIANSPAIINKDAVYGPVKQALDRFSEQVNPNADLAKIRAAWDEFKNHPSFAKYTQKENDLISAIQQKQESVNSALQDAGRFQTMEAQQRNLAHGGGVTKSPNQPSNEPYINTGVTGGTATSPSAYPVPGEVRVPGRYTSNIDRVPEAASARMDAMKLVAQRKAELQQAQSDLDAFMKAGGSGIPIQLAQQLKVGTYRILNKKYGQVATADDEAQKAIARGLKEEIAKAAPNVGPQNAKESELINALKILERRNLMEGNKNIAGLAWLGHGAGSVMGMLADSNSFVKGALARGANATGVLSPLLQQNWAVSPIVTNGILSELQRQKETQ